MDSIGNILGALFVILSMFVCTWVFGFEIGCYIGRKNTNKIIDDILKDLERDDDDLK